MGTLEIVGSCVVSALAGGSVIGLVVKTRARRALVAMRTEAARNMATDQKLWARVDTLELRIDQKDAECDQKIDAIRCELDECKQGHAASEEKIRNLTGELVRLRSDMRRDDDTSPGGIRRR